MMPFLNVFLDSVFDEFWRETGGVLEDLLVSKDDEKGKVCFVKVVVLRT